MADQDSFPDFAEYRIRLFEIMSRVNAIELSQYALNSARKTWPGSVVVEY
jgi:hypothetical protein